MSWFPGGRWSPVRQGISAGIGDTAAGGGVSDQIRRLMQSTPSSGSRSNAATRTGFAQSGSLPLVGGAVSWTVPAAAVEGYRLMAVSVSVVGVVGGEKGIFMTQPFPILDGGGFLPVVMPVGAHTLVVSVDGSGGSADFVVHAW